MEIFRSNLYHFTLSDDDEVLNFIWEEETGNMTERDYKKALEHYAEMVKKHKPKFLLADVRHFMFPMSPKLAIWRDDEICPLYAKSGVEKFAYVVNEEELEKMKGGYRLHESGFEEKYFDSAEDANLWFND